MAERISGGTSVTKENRPNYEILKDPDLRMEYVRLIDRLIHEIQQNDISHVIALDKSARPVAWMLRSLWPILSDRDANGEIPRVPDVSFLRIDRKLLESEMGRSEDGGVSMDNVSPERIDSLRTIFADQRREPMPGEEFKTVLDGRNVAIIDEVRVTGDTLDMARRLMEYTIPEATYHPMHWMIPRIKTDPKSGVRYNDGLPIWYSDKTQAGRLVADKGEPAMTWRSRRGDGFLATRFAKPTDIPEGQEVNAHGIDRKGIDTKGRQLRREMGYLATEISDKLLPVFPDIDREDFPERIERFNGMTAREFAELRGRAAKTGRSVVELYRQAR